MKMRRILPILFYCLISGSISAQWTALTSNTSSTLNSIFFLNSNIGFIVGDNGVILKTTNGTDWQSIVSPTSANLSKVYFFNNDTGFIVGFSGTVLKTINGGQTWIENSLNSSYNFYSVLFTSANIGYIGGGQTNNGYQAVLFRTTNGGNTWTDVYHGAEGVIYDIDGVNDSTLFMAGNWMYRGYILKTDNYGNNVNVIYTSLQDQITSIQRVNQNILYATGEALNLATENTFKSVDGGLTWNTCGSTSGRSIFCIDENTNYIVGKNGIINLLNNCSELIQISSTISNLMDVLFISNSLGYIVGANGTILKTTNGGGETPPIILQQPSSLSNICKRSNVSFAVNVAGTAPISYQWQHNNANILNANNNILNLTNVSDSDSGDYRCIVTNSAGSEISNNAHLSLMQIITPSISQVSTMLVASTSNNVQWYNAFGSIDGATSQIYVPTVSGDYFVLVSANGCFSDTSNIIHFSIGGIDEINGFSINVYPNYTTDIITIDSDYMGRMIFMVSNLQGEILKILTISNKKTMIDLSNFATGLYMIKLETDDGNIIKKIIKL